jgi:hypothetical protein
MNKSQLKIMFFMLILAAATPLFAEGELAALGLSGMENFGTKVAGGFFRHARACHTYLLSLRLWYRLWI